jgi:hypothetical protein
MTPQAMIAIVTDGATQGLGLVAILEANPGLPTLLKLKTDFPEVAQAYLDSKQRQLERVP